MILLLFLSLFPMTQGFGVSFVHTDKEVILMQLPLSDEFSFILAKLYEDYRQPLLRYLLTLTHDEPWAEDLCHDAFLRAGIAIARREPGVPTTTEHFKNWLYTIARNLAYDQYRKNKRLRFYSLADNSEVVIEGHEERLVERIALSEIS